MMDRPMSGPCVHDSCRCRAVRAGVCLEHWRELYGTGYGPWPDDVDPASWRDRYLQRHGVPYEDVKNSRRRIGAA